MATDDQLGRSRSSKPLMEKRRRARINDSLLQLKNLVLDALNKNNPRHSKLEKADILEMTVRYLQSIHRQQLSGMAPHNEQANIVQYQTGYAECMREVSRYLNATSNANNASNRAIILHNLTTKEATERHVQASLLNHLVTQCTDYNAGPEKITIQEQKNAGVTPSLVGSNSIPTLQFYASNETPSMASGIPLDVSASRIKEVTGRGGRPLNTVLSSSVYSEGGSIATVDPQACPSVNPTLPMEGEGITLVLPKNLVYSGQIPTHVIPIYAASSPVISQAPLQPSSVLSNVPSLSSSTPVMLTPVASGIGHASSVLGSAVASVKGGFAFIPTPPTSANSAPPPNSLIDSSDNLRQSLTSSQPNMPTLTDEAFLDAFKSRGINPPLLPSSFSISSPISSSSPPSPSSSSSALLTHDNTSCRSATTTSPPPITKTTTFQQPSHQSHPVHTKLMTENTIIVTKPCPEQNEFRSVAPSQTTVSPMIPTSGQIPSLIPRSNGITPPASQQLATTTMTSGASNTPSQAPNSVKSHATKRQRTTICQATEQLGLQNITPPAPLPGMVSNKTTLKIAISSPDIQPTTSRCRSLHRSRSIPDRPVVPSAPQPPNAYPNRNERRIVRDLGVSHKVTWRPW